MAFSAKASDYDYTIHDAEGVVGVKDGVKHKISKKDWDRENPHIEHRNSGCTECTFVQDKETLFVFIVPRDLKEKATNDPLFFGKFTMPGWTGHSSFYLFRCKYDGTVVIDYPHGYTSMGSCYLRCSCGAKLILTKKEDYDRDNIAIPPIALGFRENYKNNLKIFDDLKKSKPMDLSDAVASIEDKGVRVIVPDQKIRATKGLKINFWNTGLVLLTLLTIVIFFITHPNWRPF